MIYHEMAKDAGIKMSTCYLKKIDGLNHLMIQDFMDFAEDFVDKPMEKIQKVLDMVRPE